MMNRDWFGKDSPLWASPRWEEELEVVIDGKTVTMTRRELADRLCKDLLDGNGQLEDPLF
jgi:hypothetical protein